MHWGDILAAYSVKNKTKSDDIPSYRNFFACFIICVVFGSLFVARLHFETLIGQSLKIFSSDNGTYADWFLYCKELIFFVIAVIIFIYAIGERIFPDKPYRINPLFEKKAELPLLLIIAYFVLSFCSAIFSDNPEVVWWGVCTEFEGMAAIFSYCILFLGGYNFFSHKKTLSFYKKALFVLISLSSAIAIFEYVVSPIMELPFMKYLIAPSEYREIAASLEFSNTFREAVLMFYNSNYMGGFCVIIFPLSVYYVITSERLKKRILCSIACAATFIAGIMSNATAAFYVMLAEVIFITVIMLLKKLIHIKSFLILLLSAEVIILSVNIASGNEFIANIIKSAINSGTYSENANTFKLDEININGNSVVFSGNDSEYTVTPPFNEGDELKISGAGNTMFTENHIDNNQIMITDIATNSNIGIVLNEGVLYIDFGYKKTVDFAVTTNGLKAIVQNAELIDNIPKSQFNNSSLEKYYGFATGRGYIWLNSIPILKDCLLIGKGAGNFPFYFVQNDIVGLANTNGTSQIIVDKPHSWYMQIAVTSGIPALIAIVILLGGFAVSGGIRAFKTTSELYFKDKNRIFLLCLYVGLCGFMITGLINDSIITVNPFFWFNFGIAYCLNDSYKMVV